MSTTGPAARAYAVYNRYADAGKRRLPTRLRARIVTVYATAATVAVCVSLLAGYVALTSLLRSAATGDLTARADDLSAAVEANDPMPVRRDPYAQLISGGVVVLRSPAAPPRPLVGPAALAAATERGTQVTTQVVPGLGDEALVAVRPLSAGRYVVVASSLTVVNAASKRILLGLVVIAPMLVLGLTLVVRHLVDVSLRPIAALTTRAAALGAATPGQRLPEPAAADEVGTLARTLNGMLDRIDAATARERAFVDDAAHELRTPVAVLRAELELGLTDPDPLAARRALTAALAEADRLTSLANDLLVLARARAGALTVERVPVDVTSVVRDTSRRLAGGGDPAGMIHAAGAAPGADGTGGRAAGGRPAAITVTGEELVADVDPARLDQVVTNLVTNAVAAGARTVRVGIDRGPRGGVSVVVADDGPGFADALLPVTFDRFNRGAPAPAGGRTGTGLGLAIVAALARAHDGSVSAGNDSPLGGARVRVTLAGPGAA